MLEASEYLLACARNFAWGAFFVVLGLTFLLGASNVARILYNECSG